jgi:hypothetical protein
MDKVNNTGVAFEHILTLETETQLRDVALFSGF